MQGMTKCVSFLLNTKLGMKSHFLHANLQLPENTDLKMGTMLSETY